MRDAADIVLKILTLHLKVFAINISFGRTVRTNGSIDPSSVLVSIAMRVRASPVSPIVFSATTLAREDAASVSDALIDRRAISYIARNSQDGKSNSYSVRREVCMNFIIANSDETRRAAAITAA